MSDLLPRFARLRPLLQGPPPAVPGPLDRVAEQWARFGPRLRITLGVLLAVLLAAAVAFRLVSSPWGAPTTVLVARQDLPLGHPVRSNDLTRTTWPADLVPVDAWLDPPEGRLTSALPAGTVLTGRHLDDGGLRSALAADEAAVAVPTELLPSVPAGTTLDLVGAGHDGGGQVLASDVAVLQVDDERIWIGVPRSLAAEVAAAAAGGALTGVLLPP